MKIAILSDTHNLLRPEVVTILQGSDHILHCGDISRQDILDSLEQIAPVRVVADIIRKTEERKQKIQFNAAQVHYAD